MKIIKIAKKHNLHVIEDAAQAMGAYYIKNMQELLEQFQLFLFILLKNLNAVGDGGFCNNK